ncbi:uncharacterized protein BDZ83DRAFT_440810 [Colletotrichum acutatum]|uniref:Uncharacterized protein n=1 Tax=Glomerella acutata TaxID=27357 RepID=A0AAD8XEN3_GLOAC|nr:uncharacterized protein BDZ83DRAFT_440810 [Colletotrichum acutatum]KAK1721192.1 hypothetical protein BDZ83DRAFT_440810 [Colletotrichum acutatum]
MCACVCAVRCVYAFARPPVPPGTPEPGGASIIVNQIRPHTRPIIPPQEIVSVAVLDRPTATGGRWGDPSSSFSRVPRSSTPDFADAKQATETKLLLPLLRSFVQGTEIRHLEPADPSVPNLNHGHSSILPIPFTGSRPFHVPPLGFPNPEIPSLGSIFRDVLFFSLSPPQVPISFSLKKTFTIRPSFPLLCAIAFSHVSSSAEPQKLLHSTIKSPPGPQLGLSCSYPVFPSLPIKLDSVQDPREGMGFCCLKPGSRGQNLV